MQRWHQSLFAFSISSLVFFFCFVSPPVCYHSPFPPSPYGCHLCYSTSPHLSYLQQRCPWKKQCKPSRCKNQLARADKMGETRQTASSKDGTGSVATCSLPFAPGALVLGQGGHLPEGWWLSTAHSSRCQSLRCPARWGVGVARVQARLPTGAEDAQRTGSGLEGSKPLARKTPSPGPTWGHQHKKQRLPDAEVLTDTALCHPGRAVTPWLYLKHLPAV